MLECCLQRCSWSLEWGCASDCIAVLCQPSCLRRLNSEVAHSILQRQQRQSPVNAAGSPTFALRYSKNRLTAPINQLLVRPRGRSCMRSGERWAPRYSQCCSSQKNRIKSHGLSKMYRRRPKLTTLQGIKLSNQASQSSEDHLAVERPLGNKTCDMVQMVAAPPPAVQRRLELSHGVVVSASRQGLMLDY